MIAEWVELPAIATERTTEIHIPGSGLQPPAITYLVRERLWRLERAYAYETADWCLHVERGFLFDLASIPRAAWKLCAPFELSISAPLIHDALYRYGGRPHEHAYIHPWRGFTRAEADRLFLDMMGAEGVGWLRRYPAYAAVRAFGASAWRTI